MRPMRALLGFLDAIKSAPEMWLGSSPDVFTFNVWLHGYCLGADLKWVSIAIRANLGCLGLSEYTDLNAAIDHVSHVVKDHINLEEKEQ